MCYAILKIPVNIHLLCFKNWNATKNGHLQLRIDNSNYDTNKDSFCVGLILATH